MSGAAARQTEGSGIAKAAPPSPAKRAKLAAFLITDDAELWPAISPQLPAKLQFRQMDSIDELLAQAPPDTPAVVLWDARGGADKSEELSRIQSHSACFAMLVIDDDEAAWASALQHGQIVGLVPVPVDQSRLTGTLVGAYEEVNARVALLGGRSKAPPSVGGRRRLPRKTLAAAVVILIAAMAVLVLRRPAADPREPPSVSAGAPQPARSAPGPDAPAPGAPASAALPAAAEEKVDALIDQAQRAMRDRRFIDPVEGSALSLYRSALVLDPSSGEARQGLQRLAEVLLARVQSALDERQFDAALQALESARSIDPSDPRLAAFDARIAKLRTELGPAEILAAVNAQNFDHAALLIDQAARTKSIGEPKLSQLREELRRHRAASADLQAQLRGSAHAPRAAVPATTPEPPTEPPEPAPESAPRAAPDASPPVQAESAAEPAAPAASPPAGGPREVAEASLIRTRPLTIDYPIHALSKEIEGQVEVGYLVTPKGVVSGLRVLVATPPGVFDNAATTAVSRLRYKPVIEAGKPVAVSTKMLVTFRLEK